MQAVALQQHNRQKNMPLGILFDGAVRENLLEPECPLS